MKQNLMAAMVLLLAASCQNSKETGAPDHERGTASTQEQAKRGEYLVRVIGCGDCHTPKKMTAQGPAPDMDRFLSGYNAAMPLGPYDSAAAAGGQWVQFKGDLTAAAGPWGVSFAANLTPDPTGLGNWSRENFMKAMKHGKYKGIDNSRELLPPMPWRNFAGMSDEDVTAIYEYLRTIKPVSNLVPAAIAPKS